MDYSVIPTFREHAGYGEVRRVLSPRWYVATRLAYIRANAFLGRETYEIVAGFRPGRSQLLKFGFERQQGAAALGTQANIVSVQFVTTLGLISVARH
jgi:hypothetical protein